MLLSRHTPWWSSSQKSGRAGSQSNPCLAGWLGWFAVNPTREKRMPNRFTSIMEYDEFVCDTGWSSSQLRKPSCATETLRNERMVTVMNTNNIPDKIGFNRGAHKFLPVNRSIINELRLPRCIHWSSCRDIVLLLSSWYSPAQPTS